MIDYTKPIVIKPGQLYKSPYGTIYIITDVCVNDDPYKVRYYAVYKRPSNGGRLKGLPRFGVSDRITFEYMERLSNGA